MSAEQALLAGLPGLAFGFALLLARVGAAAMLLPGVGEAGLPATIRVGVVVALSMLLLPVVAPMLPVMPDAAFDVLRIVAGELAAGLMLGWLARLMLLALGAAGQFVASLTGLANVLQPDPAMGAQTTALGRAFALAAPVFVLSSGLHALPISALAGSYLVVPAGAGLPAGDAARVAIEATGGMFAVSLRLAAPFVLADIAWQVSLGILSRLVPQLQVYFAAMPGQILGGMALLALLAGTIVAAWGEAATARFLSLPGAFAGVGAPAGAGP